MQQQAALVAAAAVAVAAVLTVDVLQARPLAQLNVKHSRRSGSASVVGRFHMGRSAQSTASLFTNFQYWWLPLVLRHCWPTNHAPAICWVLCRLLRQRSSMLPTLVGRSGRQALLAWRAMHHTFALYNMGEWIRIVGVFVCVICKQHSSSVCSASPYIACLYSPAHSCLDAC